VISPGTYRAEGLRLARLRITADEVTFSAAERTAAHRPAGLDARGRALLAELEVSPGPAGRGAAARDHGPGPRPPGCTPGWC
jgi:hypothetical protein